MKNTAKNRTKFSVFLLIFILSIKFLTNLLFCLKLYKILTSFVSLKSLYNLPILMNFEKLPYPEPDRITSNGIVDIISKENQPNK